MTIANVFAALTIAFAVFAFATRLGYPRGRQPREFRRTSKNRRRGLDGRVGGRREEDRLLAAQRKLRAGA